VNQLSKSQARRFGMRNSKFKMRNRGMAAQVGGKEE
jgi:hypothetical protein